MGPRKSKSVCSLTGHFGGTKARPRKQAQAQINSRGIQSVNRLFQFHAEGFVGVETLGAGDQSWGQIVVDPPVTFAVGVGEGAMGHGRAKPQSIELVVPRAQTDFYVKPSYPGK